MLWHSKQCEPCLHFCNRHSGAPHACMLHTIVPQAPLLAAVDPAHHEEDRPDIDDVGDALQIAWHKEVLADANVQGSLLSLWIAVSNLGACLPNTQSKVCNPERFGSVHYLVDEH